MNDPILRWFISPKGFSSTGTLLLRRGRVGFLTLVTLAAVGVSARGAGAWDPPEAAAKFENPLASSDTVRSIGRKLYADRCSDCHGQKGRGNGSGGADLETKPSDLTAATVQSQSDGALFWKITEGRRPMPAYRQKLSEEQRWQVVHFLRSLAPKTKLASTPRKTKTKTPQ